jgi:hypothetical protein
VLVNKDSQQVFMKYFNYRFVARAAKIPEEKLRKLVKLARQEFPNDPMMAELHALRACLAVRDGHIKIDDALRSQGDNQL